MRVLRNKATTGADKLEHKLRDSEQTVISIKSFSFQSSSLDSSSAQSNWTSSSSSMSREHASDPESSSRQEKIGKFLISSSDFGLGSSRFTSSAWKLKPKMDELDVSCMNRVVF